MRHGQSDIEKRMEVRKVQTNDKYTRQEDFVLEKSIFNNVFEKDIRRVFIYKKAERLAKAIHLVTPAFIGAESLKNRLDAIGIGLIDAAILFSNAARTALSRELLALSSVLSIARVGGVLSSMNVDLIVREAHSLLREVAAYEEPRLSLDDAPTLSSIAKGALVQGSHEHSSRTVKRQLPKESPNLNKGQVKDITVVSDSPIKDRREAVLSVIKNKGVVSIKDISTMIIGISEKTIQRELSALIGLGMVSKKGERRWSTYSLVSAPL